MAIGLPGGADLRGRGSAAASLTEFAAEAALAAMACPSRRRPAGYNASGRFVKGALPMRQPRDSGIKPMASLFQHAFNAVVAVLLSSLGMAGSVAAAAAPQGPEAMMGTPRHGLTSNSMSIAFSPDGQMLAIGEEDGRVWLWDAVQDRPLSELPWRGQGVTFVGFTGDGETLVAGGGELVMAFDVDKRREQIAIDLGANLTHASLSPAEPIIATATHGRTTLYDLATGESLHDLELGHTRPYDLAFSPDGTMIACAAANRRISFFSADDGHEIGEAIQVDFLVRAVTFTPDGASILLGGHGGVIETYNVKRRELGQQLRRGVGRQVNELILCAEGKRLAGRSSGQVMVWQLDDEDKEPTTFTRSTRVYSPRGRALAISPDGTKVAAANRASGHGFDLWRVDDGRRPGSRDGHIGPVRRLAASTDGRTLLSWGEDQQLLAWDIADHEPRHLGEVPWEAYFSDLKAGEDSAWAASFITAIGHVTRIDFESGEKTQLIDGHGDKRSAAFMPGADVAVTVGWRGGIDLQNLTPWQHDRELTPTPSPPGAMAFTPDTRWAAMLEADAVSLWQTDDTWRLFGRYAIDPASENASKLALRTDAGLAAVSTNDGRLRIVELPTGGLVADYGTGESVTRPRPVQFLPDHPGLVLTVDDSGALITLDLLEAEARLHNDPGLAVSSLEVIEASQLIAAGTTAGTVLLYPLPEAPARPGAALDEQTAEALWRDLASGDAARGYRAALQLARGGDEAVEWLASNLAPAALDKVSVDEHLVNLDAPIYEQREQAMEALIGMGRPVRPQVRKHLDAREASVEAEWRLRTILSHTRHHHTDTPDARRTIRAVTALRISATAEARRLLAEWAEGAEDALLTLQATEALRWIQQRAEE